jgi:hypothetical protein
VLYISIIIFYFHIYILETSQMPGTNSKRLKVARKKVRKRGAPRKDITEEGQEVERVGGLVDALVGSDEYKNADSKKRTRMIQESVANIKADKESINTSTFDAIYKRHGIVVKSTRQSDRDYIQMRGANISVVPAREQSIEAATAREAAEIASAERKAFDDAAAERRLFEAKDDVVIDVRESETPEDDSPPLSEDETGGRNLFEDIFESIRMGASEVWSRDDTLDDDVNDTDIRDDEYIDPVTTTILAPPEPAGGEPDDVVGDLQDGMDMKHGEHLDTAEVDADAQGVRYADEDAFEEDPDFTGGNGDLLNERNGLNYVNELDGVESKEDRVHADIDDPWSRLGGSFDAEVAESGLPRTERKFDSHIASDAPGVHNWDGGAGDDPESIGMRDFNRSELLRSSQDDEAKFAGIVNMDGLVEDFGDPSHGLGRTPLEKQIQAARRARARGGRAPMPKMFPTKVIRQKQPEEGASKLNSRKRYDQVALARESALNHMRSVSELMPTA